MNRVSWSCKRIDGDRVSYPSWSMDRTDILQVEKKKQLLASLSSYNYQFKFKQACRKRYGTTCSWLFHNKEFNDWLNDDESSLFWCHGIRECFFWHLALGLCVGMVIYISRLGENCSHVCRFPPCSIVYRLIPAQRKYYWCLVDSQTGKVPFRRLLFLSTR